MPTATVSSPPSPDALLPGTGAVDQLDPQRVRVVDVEHANTDTVVRRDCYDPAGSLNQENLSGVQRLFQLVDGEVYLRTVDWARSGTMESSVELQWVPTGIQAEEVDQIRVFTWPEAELSRVFKDTG